MRAENSPLSLAAQDDHNHPKLRFLIKLGEQLHRRGWMLGTSGSLSFCETRDPLTIVITVSGADKGALELETFIKVTDRDNIFATLGDPKASSEAFFKGDARPSGESLVHRAIYLAIPSATAVVHTHSVWSTLCSQLVAPGGALRMEGLEMLKGIGHWEESPLEIPVVANARHIPTLADLVKRAASNSPQVPGVLVEGHGIYLWGQDLLRAKKHAEIFEFLFEHEIRRRSLKG